MNVKRVVLAGVASFLVVFGITSALNIGTPLFTWIYAGSEAAQRAEPERLARLPYLLPGVLFGQIVFAYVYARSQAQFQGVPGAIRLGLIVALIGVVPGNIGEWVLYPVDGRLPLGMIPYQLFEGFLSGLIVGMVYKPYPVAQREAPTPLM